MTRADFRPRLGILDEWRLRLKATVARSQRHYLGRRGHDGAGHMEEFRRWCESNRGSAVELLLSPHVLHELCCDDGLPLHTTTALEGYARQQFASYFGAVGETWTLAVWRSRSGRVCRCGASALHGIELSSLITCARSFQIAIRAVRPMWAMQLKRVISAEPGLALAPVAYLAVVDGVALTWVRMMKGCVVGLRQQLLRSATHSALAEAIGARPRDGDVVIVGHGLESGMLPSEPGLRVLDLLDAFQPQMNWRTPKSAPWLQGMRALQPAWPLPDFLGRPRPHPALVWPTVAATALMLLFSLLSAGQSYRTMTAAQSQMSEMRARLLHSRRQVPASQPVIRPDAERAYAETQKALQHAWEPLLTSVELVGAASSVAPGARAPGQHVVWLAMNYTVGRNDIVLEGIAPSRPAALQASARLGSETGWHDVILTRLEDVTALAVPPGQRFELKAKFQSQALPSVTAFSVKQGRP